MAGTLAVARSFQINRTTRVYLMGWIALAVLALVGYCGSQYSGLTFTDHATNIIAIAVLVSASLLFYSLFGRTSRVGAMLRYLALWIANIPVASVFTYVFASFSFPAIDDALDRLDKALGFDWLVWYNFVNTHSSIQFVLAFAYVSVSTQIILSFIYFSHREEPGRCNELWWTSTIALVITTVISGILPAMGTYEYYGVIDTEHGRHLHDLHGLRDGTLTSFSMEKIKGIITLPSYHTVLAILLTYIYRNQRRILYLALPLNLLMLISIPSQGGHYLADMFAGAAVAGLSIYIFARSSLDASKQA